MSNLTQQQIKYLSKRVEQEFTEKLNKLNTNANEQRSKTRKKETEAVDALYHKLFTNGGLKLPRGVTFKDYSKDVANKRYAISFIDNFIHREPIEIHETNEKENEKRRELHKLKQQILDKLILEENVEHALSLLESFNQVDINF